MRTKNNSPISALNIARQMVGTVCNKKVHVIGLNNEADYLREKRPHTSIFLSLDKLVTTNTQIDVMYGYSLFDKGDNEELLNYLVSNIQPNGIAVSIQPKERFLSIDEMQQIMQKFPNTVVDYCSLLPKKWRFVEEILFLIVPRLKYWSKSQVIRIQQKTPEIGDVINNNSSKEIFDEKYFTDYYEPMIGNFSRSDLERNKNWFYGWFEALREWYDFQIGNNKKALEIGCSIGAAAEILSERGFDVCATDISSTAIINAKKILPNIDFKLLDIEKTQSELGKYDLIYAFEVIEHLNNPRLCISNMYSLLADGGSLICSTPYPYPYVYFDETHISVKYPQEWIEIFKQAGFQNVKFKQVGFIPFFYRFSKHLHITLPFGLATKYINSPVFIYGEK